jgi:hypothetical protein
MNGKSIFVRLRRLRRRWHVLGIAVVCMVLAAVPVAWASHQFTDVPDGSPFHADIGAIRDAGITSGKTCEPPGTAPTFCPGESITREAMAAFVHRGFGRTGWTVGAPETFGTNEGLRDIAVLTINVGGVPGQTAFVKLDGAVTTSIASLVGCPCGLKYHLVRDGATAFADRYLTNSTLGPGGGLGYETGAVTAVAVVPTGTTQTFRIQARRDGQPPITGTLDAYADLTAITAPFGSTGGNTLVAAQTSARTAARK